MSKQVGMTNEIPGWPKSRICTGADTHTYANRYRTRMHNGCTTDMHGCAADAVRNVKYDLTVDEDLRRHLIDLPAALVCAALAEQTYWVGTTLYIVVCERD